MCTCTQARTSLANSDQGKGTTSDTRKSSRVETRKTSRLETTAKATENGETCHEVSTVEAHQINKVEVHKMAVKDNDSSEVSKPTSAGNHHVNNGSCNDVSFVNQTSSSETCKDNPNPPLKNQI